MRSLLRRMWRVFRKGASFVFGAFYRSYMREAFKHHYCHGDPSRLFLGESVSTVNTIFNVVSGNITVGDNTIFGHNCMVLTGRHQFSDGKRRSLAEGEGEVPAEGYDVSIGSGCWIASGAIVVGGVSIGDNTIVGAGAVVTTDLPSGVFAAGVPAKVKRKTTP